MLKFIVFSTIMPYISIYTLRMIAENIQNIGKIVEKTAIRAGRSPEDIQCIAVSKTFTPDNILDAYRAGIKDFGENYVQELTEKRKILQEKDLRWHFIGHLQSNKVKYIAEWITMIHSVDSVGLAAEIDKRGRNAGRIIDVLVEVNTSREATKFGVEPEKAIELLRSVSEYSHIRLKGLMTIGPFSDDHEASRRSFRQLRSLFQEANNAGFLKEPMTTLSMGMTHDFEIAIEEGSTLLRIGTAIFGSRSSNVH